MPTHPMAARLEHVRSSAGVTELKQFWRALGYPDVEHPERTVSYEAARRYHFDREPPAGYLARVADRFSVRLEWLISGEGEVGAMSPADWRALVWDRAEAMIAYYFPPFRDAARPVRGYAAGAVERIAMQASGPPNARILWAANLLGQALAAPAAQIHVGLEAPSTDAWEHYILGVCQALSAIAAYADVPELPDPLAPWEREGADGQDEEAPRND